MYFIKPKEEYLTCGHFLASVNLQLMLLLAGEPVNVYMVLYCHSFTWFSGKSVEKYPSSVKEEVVDLTAVDKSPTCLLYVFLFMLIMDGSTLSFHCRSGEEDDLPSVHFESNIVGEDVPYYYANMCTLNCTPLLDVDSWYQTRDG